MSVSTVTPVVPVDGPGAVALAGVVNVPTGSDAWVAVRKGAAAGDAFTLRSGVKRKVQRPAARVITVAEGVVLVVFQDATGRVSADRAPVVVGEGDVVLIDAGERVFVDSLRDARVVLLDLT